uniref:Uncharacterized protein n=1 Tax=Rhizophora mucronata TaxID=61149 RepID=A0A2P2K1K0_RHIMU
MTTVPQFILLQLVSCRKIAWLMLMLLKHL